MNNRKKQAKVAVAFGVACGLLVLLIGYFNGCGACENDAACDGLFGECVCTGNHAGEYCEHSCGEFGRVSGSACELDGKVGNMIMRSDHNDATVQAVTYTGLNTALSWQLQHELCNAAGKATPAPRAAPAAAGRSGLAAPPAISIGFATDAGASAATGL